MVQSLSISQALNLIYRYFVGLLGWVFARLKLDIFAGYKKHRMNAVIHSHVPSGMGIDNPYFPAVENRRLRPRDHCRQHLIQKFEQAFSVVTRSRRS